MRIDASIEDLVCIQLRDSERADFEERLRGLSTGRDRELRLTGENGTALFQLVPSGIQINCSNRRFVTILMCKSECVYLADAIAEHVADANELPLDHSFEALGAKIEPSTVKDVVIETCSQIAG
jgi:hypothetical protein